MSFTVYLYTCIYLLQYKVVPLIHCVCLCVSAVDECIFAFSCSLCLCVFYVLLLNLGGHLYVFCLCLFRSASRGVCMVCCEIFYLSEDFLYYMY